MSTSPTSSASLANPYGVRHVGFIMDGNGRWATRQGMPRMKGHVAGIETVRVMIEACAELNIPYATFYTFSTENWRRSAEEVGGIFDLMRMWFKKELKTIKDKGGRILFIGNRTDGRLAPDIIELMEEVERETAHNTKVTAIFAINYSGRDELTRIANNLAQNGQPITEQAICDALDTAGIPDPDLVIRTSGEQRLSNFMLWQLAYAELYFSQTTWPAFAKADLLQALENFSGRERRFGAVPA